jgi:hypothetical protein
MKIPSLQTFILQEDLNHTLLNDIYVMASAPNTTEEYGQRLQKITADDILRRFQTEAWPEILDILTREFLHIMDSDAADVERLESVLGINGVKQLRSFGNMMHNLNDPVGEDVPVGFANVQEIFKQLKSSFTLHTMINAFEQLSWQPEYGGEAWADITKAVLKIGEALNQKSFTPFYKALDHFVDLAHNTNSVLDKFKGYDERWLFYWVDLKRYSKSVYDLNPISKSVKEYLKVSRQDIPQQLRQRTPAKQNLYEVLLRGKQFLNELSLNDHNFNIHHLKGSSTTDDAVLTTLKRNRISIQMLIQTMQQIIENVETRKETLIEQQERNNYRRIKAFLRDIHGIFYGARHLKQEEQVNVLRRLGINPTNNPGVVINYWLQQSNIASPSYT